MQADGDSGTCFGFAVRSSLPFSFKDSSGAIFLIFAGSDKKERQHVAYVEIKDGVVTKKWRA